jgi:hypothetical protein
MIVSVQVLRTAADRRGEQKQREGSHRQQKHADEEIPELGKVRGKREKREREGCGERGRENRYVVTWRG